MSARPRPVAEAAAEQLSQAVEQRLAVDASIRRLIVAAKRAGVAAYDIETRLLPVQARMTTSAILGELMLTDGVEGAIDAAGFDREREVRVFTEPASANRRKGRINVKVEIFAGYREYALTTDDERRTVAARVLDALGVAGIGTVGPDPGSALANGEAVTLVAAKRSGRDESKPENEASA